MAKNDARDDVEASILSLYLSWLFKPLPHAPSQHTPLSRANKAMAWLLFIFLFSCLLTASAQKHCGRDGGGDLRTLIPRSTFEEMLKHRGSLNCNGSFYTYEAFIAAANRYPYFAAVGDEEIRKREIAAFFGQTSQETAGGWDTAPDGRFAWGYCWVEQQNNQDSDCCYSSIEWPCVAGKTYCGRGPMQLTWNYNYGPAGAALGYDLLTNPDLVASDPIVSFEAALWFWMTPQPPKPSCHDVITGIWNPSPSDIAAHRLPGYGVITNIINGGYECGIGVVTTAEYRIGFYKRYCDILGLEYGDNLDCNNQVPFGSGLSSSAI